MILYDNYVIMWSYMMPQDPLEPSYGSFWTTHRWSACDRPRCRPISPSDSGNPIAGTLPSSHPGATTELVFMA